MANGNVIAKNSLFLYILTLSNYFIGLLLFPFLSRQLSVQGFGSFSYGLMLGSFFQALVDYGFMISATALVSANRHDVKGLSNVVSTVLGAKLLLGVLGYVLLGVSAIWVENVRDDLLVVASFCASGLISALIPDFYFRGVERMGGVAVRSILARIISVIVVVFVVNGDGDIYRIPLCLSAGGLFSFVVAMYQVKKDGISVGFPSFRSVRECLKEGVLYFASRFAVTINQGIGLFALGLVYSSSAVQVGLFAAAIRLSSSAEMLLTPIIDSLYPHMAHKKDYSLFRKFYIRGVLVWAALCLVVVVFAHEICVLIFGNAFREAGDLLRILMIGCFFSFSSNMFGYCALTPIGLAKYANIALLVCALVNVTLGAVIYFGGWVGASSVAMLVTQTNVMLFVLRGVVLYRNRRLIPS